MDNVHRKSYIRQMVRLANFNNGYINNNNVNNTNYVRLSASFIILMQMPFFLKKGIFKGNNFMEDKITFEEIYEAYNLCLKNKKRKLGTYKFVNDNLCENLIELVDKLNNRTYMPQPSNYYLKRLEKIYSLMILNISLKR